MKLLQRYILLDVGRSFLLTLAALTLLFLFAGVAAEAVRRGLTPRQVLTVVPYVLPGMLPYTIPATLLFGVVLSFGRMAADSEIVACKAAGIHVVRLLQPVLLLAVLCCGVTWWALNEVIPTARQRMRAVLAEQLEDVVYNVLRRDRAITTSKLPCNIYVRGVRGKELIGATFQRVDPETGEIITAYAERATMRVDFENRRIVVHMYDAEVQVGKSSVKVADEHVFPIPLPEAATRRSDSPRDMTYRTLRAAIRDLRATLAEQHDSHNSELIRRYRRLRAELHLRSVLALGSILFVLIGVPVAIIQARADVLSAFVSCFLPIVTTYYPLLLLGMNMGKEGITDPAVAMWFPNFLLGSAAIPLLRRVARY